MVGKAVFKILSDNSEVAAIVGKRIYPETATQRETFPYITYEETDVTPPLTKDVESQVFVTVQINCYDKRGRSGGGYATLADLANKVIDALYGVTGTYANEVIQMSQYLSSDDLSFEAENNILGKRITFNFLTIR